ncbi:TetR family transcriptional regulator C-terminal domain-containing protein [Desulforhopalus vacuolatus]|uniref:TetR/AcrR family transcriptional regulator n=1 Tax=Desulforhopalus vacuolatus TaxID=40414 RepID=UPI001965E0FB|nr:TetR/AcrR family transcriptional regulator [Desulforhopalus vacuolatus]MBM9521197.1 TetR family transcriptional regulator C-terminal domain-containing protein [Desulforhopalus vacuolatus]
MIQSTATEALTRAEQKLKTRCKLLEATIDIIASEGVAGVTFARVSGNAGVSRGLCSFHFENKEHLMLETLRMLYAKTDLAWRSALTEPDTAPEQRLTSMIKVLLSPPIADPKALTVLVAYWGLTPHREHYLKFFTEGDLAYEESIEGVMRELADGQEMIHGMSLRAVAVMLTSMIDGIYVQYLIAPGRLSCQEGVQGCLTFLATFFPQFFSIIDQ